MGHEWEICEKIITATVKDYSSFSLPNNRKKCFQKMGNRALCVLAPLREIPPNHPKEGKTIRNSLIPQILKIPVQTSAQFLSNK